jgi:hypothetical protein
VFQRVVHDYPHTAAARQAMVQLAELGAPPIMAPVAASASAPASEPMDAQTKP